MSVAPLPSKAPSKYENPKLIWLQCNGTFGIRQTQRSVFLLPSCSSEQRVCVCQPLNGGLPRSVFAGQLRRNSIVCPTEFYGETSPSCCFLGVLPRKVQILEACRVTFDFPAATWMPTSIYIYKDASNVNPINICPGLITSCCLTFGNEFKQTKQLEVNLRTFLLAAVMMINWAQSFRKLIKDIESTWHSTVVLVLLEAKKDLLITALLFSMERGIMSKVCVCLCVWWWGWWG